MRNLQIVQKAILPWVLGRMSRGPEDLTQWCSLAVKGNGEGEEWQGTFRTTYFQRRMADMDSGGKKINISKQEQKWWLTVLIFLNTFQILEKTPASELENHYGQLEGSVTWTIKSTGPQQTACRRNSSLPTKPARIQSVFSPCWHGRCFPGPGPEPLHSFPQQLLSWNAAEYFFLFIPPRQKSLWCYLMWQASFPIILISFKEKHPTRKHNATQQCAKGSKWGAWNSFGVCLRGWHVMQVFSSFSFLSPSF